MPTRGKTLRAVAQAAAGLALLPLAPRRGESSVLVNDIHSQFNPWAVNHAVFGSVFTALSAGAVLGAALTRHRR